MLRGINVNAYQSEGIYERFSVGQNEVIITEKRIICVRESRRNDLSHWSILFRDMMHVELEAYDKASKQVVDKRILDELCK